MKTHNIRPPVLALTGAAALVVVAGCADDGAGEPPQAPVITENGVPENGTPDEPTGDTPTHDAPTDDARDDVGQESPTGEADTPAAGDVPGEYDGVLAAIDLAAAEHDGASAFEVDDGDGGIWEVHVAVGDDDIEVHVSADGTEVLSSEREADLDSDDRAGLEAAGGFTLADAVRVGIAEYGGTAPVDDVTISDEDGGAYAWEVAFADDVEVYLDIATGEVLRVEHG